MKPVNKSFLSKVQVTLGVIFGVGTYIIPLFTQDKVLLVIIGSIFVTIVFVIMFRLNQIIIKPNNEHYLVPQTEKTYYRNSNIIDNKTNNWFRDLDTIDAIFVERFLSFAFLSMPFEQNSDMKYKRQGIIGYLLYIQQAPALMNSFFDNSFEINRAIELGLINHKRYIFFNQRGESNFSRGDKFQLFRPHALVIFTFIKPDNLSYYQLTDRSMQLMELIWDRKEFTENNTAIAVLKSKLKEICMLDIFDYQVVPSPEGTKISLLDERKIKPIFEE